MYFNTQKNIITRLAKSLIPRGKALQNKFYVYAVVL